jgi:hypothetical protein
MIIPEIKSPGNQDSLYLRSRSSRSIAVVPSLVSGIPNPFSKGSSLLAPFPSQTSLSQAPPAINKIYKRMPENQKFTSAPFFRPSTLTKPWSYPPDMVARLHEQERMGVSNYNYNKTIKGDYLTRSQD